MNRRLAGRGMTGRGRSGEELQDLLSMVPDRVDLETLFERRVGLPQILRLTGRDVSRSRINELLSSDNLHGDLRKLLDS